MVPSRETLLKGFVFDPNKIDWDYYRKKFPDTCDAAVFLMESSIQKHRHIENAKIEIRKRRLNRKIDKILRSDTAS